MKTSARKPTANGRGKKRGAPPREDADDTDPAPAADDSDGEDGAKAALLPMSMSNNIKAVCHATQDMMPRPWLPLGALMAARGRDPLTIVAGMSDMGTGVDAMDAAFKVTPQPATDRGGVEGILATMAAAVESTQPPGMDIAGVAGPGVDPAKVRAASVTRMSYMETAACLCIPPPRFDVGGTEVTAPPCASGDQCVIKEAAIKGLPLRPDIQLMAYMTGAELQALRTHAQVPANVYARPCVLCMRAIQAFCLYTLDSTNALKQLNPAAAGSRVVVCSMVNPVGPGQYKASKCLSPSTFAALVDDYMVAPSFGELYVSPESPLPTPWRKCLNADSMLWIREDHLRQPVDGSTPDMLPPLATIAPVPDAVAEGRKAGSRYAAHAPLEQYASVVGSRHGNRGDPHADPLAVSVAGVPSAELPAASDVRVATAPFPPFGAAVARSAPPFSGGGATPAVIRGAGATVGDVARRGGVRVPKTAAGLKTRASFPLAGEDGSGVVGRHAKDPPSHTGKIEPWSGVSAGRAVTAAAPRTEEPLVFGDDDDEEGEGTARVVCAGVGPDRRRLGTVRPLQDGAVVGLTTGAKPSDF